MLKVQLCSRGLPPTTAPPVSGRFPKICREGKVVCPAQAPLTTLSLPRMLPLKAPAEARTPATPNTQTYVLFGMSSSRWFGLFSQSRAAQST